jgi:hypothetical protein
MTAGAERPQDNSRLDRMEAPTVQLDFLHNPLADYLYYLFARDHKDFPSFDPPGFGAIPTLNDSLVALPEIAASARIQEYRQVYPLLEAYHHLKERVVERPQPKIMSYSSTLPTYSLLASIVERGEKFYSAFLDYWRKHIQPAELRQIEAWQQQQLMHRPLEKLLSLERLPFRDAQLDVGAIALHPAGSGNYSPPGIYSSLFRKPNLPWFVGHEGTHLLLSRYVGTNWQAHPLAPRAIAVASRHQLQASDLEEQTCLFMQIALSQSCRLTAADFRLSEQQPPGSPERALLAALERNWVAYQGDTQRWPTLIDYLLKTAIAEFGIA